MQLFYMTYRTGQRTLKKSINKNICTVKWERKKKRRRVEKEDWRMTTSVNFRKKARICWRTLKSIRKNKKNGLPHKEQRWETN